MIFPIDTLHIIFKYLNNTDINIFKYVQNIMYHLICDYSSINTIKLIFSIKEITMYTHELLDWTQSMGYKYNVKTCYMIAYNGNLQLLKWVRYNRCPWNEDTCVYAAMHGHLECLKYAHENGCEWDEWTCAQAAKNGHLKSLKYAHENNCPWDEHSYAIIIENAHLKLLKRNLMRYF